MPADTILTMANLRGFDLLDPHVEDVDFRVVAEHLGKEKRFNGATPDAEYSVGQHSYLGADAILAAGGTRRQAAYFLLHDAKEGFIKDDTTPKKYALARLIERRCGVLASRILECHAELEGGIDRVIHAAAGLPFPLSREDWHAVKRMDLVMFVTEWRDLMHGAPHPNWHEYEGIQPLAQRIQPLSWAQARAGWLLRAQRLIPSFGGAI